MNSVETLSEHDLFCGERVRLAQVDAQTAAEAVARWRRDSLYLRLLDDQPPFAISTRQLKEMLEDDRWTTNSNNFSFFILARPDDRLIGFVDLMEVRWADGDAWLGIAIGERQDWGRAYGADALRLVLRYAFDELNLHRVTLEVLGYNRRAIRAYEKVGFQIEGCERGMVFRDRERVDIYSMGILRSEWRA